MTELEQIDKDIDSLNKQLDRLYDKREELILKNSEIFVGKCFMRKINDTVFMNKILSVSDRAVHCEHLKNNFKEGSESVIWYADVVSSHESFENIGTEITEEEYGKMKKDIISKITGE